MQRTAHLKGAGPYCINAIQHAFAAQQDKMSMSLSCTKNSALQHVVMYTAFHVYDCAGGMEAFADRLTLYCSSALNIHVSQHRYLGGDLCLVQHEYYGQLSRKQPVST